jgi:Lar family restriction alleviation protein
MTDLLPCPFCGSSNLHYEPDNNICGVIQCQDCLAYGPVNLDSSDPFFYVQDAEKAWNNRAGAG